MLATQRRERAIADEPPPLLDVNADALFLDLDGTLVEFAARPGKVQKSVPITVIARRTRFKFL